MKLIDKDRVVAGIDDWRDKIKKGIFSIPLSGREKTDATFEYELLGKVISFLDTHEVKEVDLEKEYDNEFFKDPVFGKLVNQNAGISIAKHFFKLAISLNNPITAADRGTAEEIIINLKRVEQDYHIDLTREMEWVRNKVKKEK
jgi:hypothetical protein